jgi:CheY-like chemotaxis protein
VEQIERAAVRAADLCQQMLAYSGKGRFLITRLDLNELVRESLTLIQASISKSATLNVTLDPALPAMNADASQVRQLLMNLVVNASEALLDDKGTISISSRSQRLTERELKQTLFTPDLPRGEYVCLEISDTGAGMGEDTRVRIFDPFYTTKFTGRGLGLPAVLGIVRGHRGAIRVDSESGQGTRFKLYFPAVAGAGERVASKAKPRSGYRGTGTILVIDDEQIVRSVTGRILQSLGFKVLAATDGEDGLARFKNHAHETVAVLLDLTMPGMDGVAVFQELRNLREDVPVLLMSGYNQQDAVSRFAGKGPAGFLQKPFTLDQLVEKLRSILPA